MKIQKKIPLSSQTKQTWVLNYVVLGLNTELLLLKKTDISIALHPTKEGQQYLSEEKYDK